MMQVHRERKGAIIPLAAVMMIFLIGMVAFGVDVGWMAVSQSELQNAADSAALAGAGALMDGAVLYYLPGNTLKQASILASTKTNAKTKAKTYAGYNGAGGVSSLTLLDSDIEFGNTDASGNYTAALSSVFPNTIKVTLRRDSTANGNLNLFFGRGLGRSSMTLTATASATIFAGSLDSIPADTLPVVYDEDDWKTFVSTGLDPDGHLSKDSSGNPQLQVYPSVKASGNFGWLSMDNKTVAASTLRSWIDNGVSQADINTLKADGLIPLSKHNKNSWDWQGKPGFTASGVMAVNDHVGEVYVMPLYKQKSASSAGTGQGSNYFYNVTQFVGIRIMPADCGNKDIVVQPAPIVVANNLLDSSTVVPVGSTPGSSTTTIFAAPRLTR